MGKALDIGLGNYSVGFDTKSQKATEVKTNKW